MPLDFTVWRNQKAQHYLPGTPLHSGHRTVPPIPRSCPVRQRQKKRGKGHMPASRGFSSWSARPCANEVFCLPVLVPGLNLPGGGDKATAEEVALPHLFGLVSTVASAPRRVAAVLFKQKISLKVALSALFVSLRFSLLNPFPPKYIQRLPLPAPSPDRDTQGGDSQVTLTRETQACSEDTHVWTPAPTVPSAKDALPSSPTTQLPRMAHHQTFF